MNRKWIYLMLLFTFGLSVVLSGCNDSDGSSQSTGNTSQNIENANAASFNAPDGPAGQYTLNLSAGSSDTEAGGAGGDFDTSYHRGSLTGDIKMFNTGQADASFTFPETVTTYLGTNPLQITSDTTISVVTSPPAAGTPYLVAGDDNIYVADEDIETADETPITGLSVAAGATLTLGLNFGSPASIAWIDLDNDLYNAGTITAANQSSTLDSGDLHIICYSFHGDTGSAIELTGYINISGEGGGGGNLEIDLKAANCIYNQGTIDTSGGSGTTNGGNAGSIELETGLLGMNTGDLTAIGGDGSTGTGGTGGDISLFVRYGNNFNSGNCNTSGGNGTSGGTAGTISFSMGYTGVILNSGNLTADGGSGSAGDGGHGSNFEFNGLASRIVNTGDISGKGGSAEGGTAGDGGSFSASNQTSWGWLGLYDPAGNIEISGNINLAGGSATGGNAGNGGDFEILINAQYAPKDQEIILYGYTAIDTSGGDGGTTGGNAGSIFCQQYPSETSAGYGPSGGIVNYIDITANGGAGGTGSGGTGGDFEMYTDPEGAHGYATEEELAYNLGDLNLNGGRGNSGGNAGMVRIWGCNGAGNLGNIEAVGGAATGDGADAGNEQYLIGIRITSDLGISENSGNIDASGGDSNGSSGSGGYGAPIQIVGYSASNSGQLSVAGGDADPTSGTGGNADEILIYGIFEGAENTASASSDFDISGGTGSMAGASGEVVIDGQNVTDNYL